MTVSMCKKGVAAGVGAALVLGLIFGRDAWSYVTTATGWAQQTVRDNVPVEFEIERARKMVKELVPDIRANMHVIAKEEVEVARLEKQIADAESKLGKDKNQLMSLKQDLSTGQTVFYYAGRRYSNDQVKLDLANRFERFKTAEATLSSMREMHTARTKGLDAARAKLDGMLAAKRQLEVDVENLEARLKMVEAAQTSASYNFDDSRLSRAKELVTELRTRLEVAERMVNSEGYLGDEIPLETSKTAEDIVDEVSRYFSAEVDEKQLAVIPAIAQ